MRGTGERTPEPRTGQTTARRCEPAKRPPGNLGPGDQPKAEPEPEGGRWAVTPKTTVKQAGNTKRPYSESGIGKEDVQATVIRREPKDGSTGVLEYWVLHHSTTPSLRLSQNPREYQITKIRRKRQSPGFPPRHWSERWETASAKPDALDMQNQPQKRIGQRIRTIR